MDYLDALGYSARREDPYAVRRKLDRVREERHRLTAQLDVLPPGPEREIVWLRRISVHRKSFALEWRLQRAEEFAVYDWEQGEREFIERNAKYISLESLAEWRRRGVPLRVLRQALRRQEG